MSNQTTSPNSIKPNERKKHKPRREVALPDQCITVTSYREFRDDIRRFADGKYNFLIIIGHTGISKTETIKELLETCGESVHVVSGSPTAFQLYCDMADHINHTLVLDDISARCYRQSDMLAYLKNLTETRTIKTVRWPTAKAPIPEYETTSRVILLANAWDSISEHVRAIEGRAFSIHFAPTPMEVHLQVGQWFKDQQVYEFVWQHLRFFNRPDMRLYVKIREQKEAGAPWQKRGLQMMLDDARLEPIADLLNNPTYKDNTERCKAFMAAGHGSRSLFYQLLQQFRYYVTYDTLGVECPKLGASAPVLTPTIKIAAKKSIKAIAASVMAKAKAKRGKKK